MSEMLVASTEHATESLGMSQIFVGLIFIPIIGNAAEHSSAVMMALKNRMDLAVSIAAGIIAV
jgi:Ca2+:H+ antiporter